MMVGPQIFEQGHQDLQDFALGHRGTNTDVAVQSRVLHSPPLIPHQTRDTLNNLVSDPSADRSVNRIGSFDPFPDLFHSYSKLIQPFFPVLAHQEGRVHHELEKVPQNVRTALLYSRDLAVAYCTSALKPEALTTRVTSELAALKAEGPQARTCDANLAYLQTLFFMALVTENSGPVQSRNTSWIAEAVSIATYLNLHQSHSFEVGDTPDEDAPRKVARRVWLSLLVLDRFHASSSASPLLVAEDGARLAASDEETMGSNAYQLVRKFRIG